MPFGRLLFCLSTLCTLTLAGCNSDTSTFPGRDDAIQATASVLGTVTTMAGGTQTVSVTFVSSDGWPITALSVGDLNSLPSGWSAPASFMCDQVTTGSGCVLNLTYAPPATASGTLTLEYTYTDNAGANETGSMAIPYTATSHDNVIATASPTGQINAVLSSGSQAVTVTFTTDDGRPATDLSLTSSLSGLPAGWSSTATAFSCATVSTGSACQLAFTYAPTVVGSGTLTLSYSYTDDSGTPKTGSAVIPFAATSDDNVVGTVSPSGQITATAGGSSTAVTVTFTTDDSNPATSLSVTGGLNPLPAGWSSGSSSLACSTVSNGATCQLALTYAPSIAGSGTLTLTYGYDNDAGNAKTGTVNISYTATAPHLYVANLFSTLDECTLGSGGALSSCTATPTSGGSASPAGIAFNGNFVYVTDFYNSEVFVCTVDSDGSFSDCTAAVTGLTAPWALAINNGYLYITSDSTVGTTMYCQIGSDGSLSNCANTANGTNLVNGIAIGGGYAYLTALNSVTGYVLDQCVVNSDGSLSGCTATGSGFSDPQFITLAGGYAYVGNQTNSTVGVCTIGAGGALTSCANSAVGSEPNGVAINGTNAYVSDDNDNIYLCTVNAGSLSGCSVSDGGATFAAPQQLAIH